MRKIGETHQGYFIYAGRNRIIGGTEYYSDSSGMGGVIVDSTVSLEELEVVVEHMRKRRAAYEKKCAKESRRGGRVQVRKRGQVAQ